VPRYSPSEGEVLPLDDPAALEINFLKHKEKPIKFGGAS